MSLSEKPERYAIRRRRLAELLKGYKTQQAFAEAAGWKGGGTYVSLVLNGHKNLGEDKARATEKKLDLPQGWFDREGDTVLAYKWPFTLTSLERVERLKPEHLVIVDMVINAQITGFEQAEAPRKKPGGGGGKGGGSSGGGAAGGGAAGVSNLPGGSTKHAPLTLVRLTPEEQQQADELALRRGKKPSTAPKPHVVDPARPATRDLFEK